MKNQPQLMLYNSLTRQKENFEPQDNAHVTMYNCGPTVYSYAHIGNARAAVVADILYRVLRFIYGAQAVTYARNITDVDDKIIASAGELGVPISEITEKYADIYNDDLTALGCLPPDHQLKATENIGGMIAIIDQLLAGDFAYQSEGHVFFDVSQFKAYGQLSGNTMDALRQGGRVGEGEVARKKNSADFVLWKPESGGVGWDAPFGHGRPGWHIECSAMAKVVLGETIDIHCGGVDLKFPHHENEIAQSQCAHNKPMARYWVHNEFLNMGREKMSKSLGNVKLIHDLRKSWDGEVIRLALLKAHYRSELIWTEELLKESKAQLDGWYRALKNNPQDKENAVSIEREESHYIASFMNDLDTPSLIRDISTTINQLNTQDRSGSAAAKLAFMRQAGDLLGLLQKDPDAWFRGDVTDDEETGIQALIDARDQAKRDKDWARADVIRGELKAKNIILEDSPEGTKWRRG